MSASLVASVSVGQCVPTMAALIAQMTAELTGKLQGFLSVQAALTISPPALGAQLDGALSLVSQIQGQIAAGLTVAPPGVNLSIAATAAAAASLNAQLAALLALTVTLGTGVGAIAVIVHEGEASTHGSEVQAVVDDIAPSGNTVHSVTYLVTAPAVWAALGTVLLTG